MKSEIEKEKLEAIRTVFSIVKEASEIINQMQESSDFSEIEQSAKIIIEYIDSEESTAVGALELINCHLRILMRQLEVPIHIVDGVDKESLALFGLEPSGIIPIGKYECLALTNNKVLLISNVPEDPVFQSHLEEIHNRLKKPLSSPKESPSTSNKSNESI